jgi:hypothetical protein
MSNALRTTVHNGSLARRAPYIYGILLSFDDITILYIGQTISKTGAIGRLAQHLSDTTGATLRQRLQTRYDLMEIDGLALEFAAVRLGEQSSFWTDEPDYREAVEWLVQLELVNAICGRKLPICVISRVESTAYTRVAYVQSEATRVTQLLLVWIETAYKPP